jgi:hypothetical protein
MLAANPINSLPVSFECLVQITIPFKVLSENILYCPAVLITKDNTSEGIGLQASAAGEDCLIMVKDNLNFSYFLTLSSSQYRFFKQIYSITCKDQTNGLYTECGQEEFIEVKPKIVEYNNNNEVEVIGTSSSSNAEEVVTKSFDNKLSDNISTVIIWIIVICSIITALIVGIIVLQCLYSQFQASKETQN